MVKKCGFFFLAQCWSFFAEGWIRFGLGAWFYNLNELGVQKYSDLVGFSRIYSDVVGCVMRDRGGVK